MSRGYVTLISVLVMGSIGISITISLLLLGLGSSRTSFANEQSNQAKFLVNGCAEEALQQIRESTSFSGNGNLSFGAGSCSYNVSNQGGQNRLITVSGTVGDVIRKAQIVVNAINPSIQITSWYEVSSF